jgi:hypothetical protein
MFIMMFIGDDDNDDIVILLISLIFILWLHGREANYRDSKRKLENIDRTQ